ncbi:MAG: protein-tyrosine-phosphatase, partial [Bryobacteraceae bacterium]
LIGNHEAMNVYGDLRYVSPGEYEAFKDGRSREVRDAFFEQHVEEMKKKTPPQPVDRAAWEKENPLGFFEHRMAFGPKGNYGRWIRRHNAVVRINDAIFLHGGVGPKYASLTGNAINTQIRAELEDFTRLQGGAAMDPEGPLWYRGLAEGAEGELAAHLDAVLKSHGAARVVIGHTPTDGAVLPRFNGRVVMIDVGLSAHYGSRTACLVIEKDQWFALHRGKKLPLPGAGVVEYLKQAAALDPPPSPLAPLIKKLEGN